MIKKFFINLSPFILFFASTVFADDIRIVLASPSAADFSAYLVYAEYQSQSENIKNHTEYSDIKNVTYSTHNPNTTLISHRGGAFEAITIKPIQPDAKYIYVVSNYNGDDMNAQWWKKSKISTTLSTGGKVKVFVYKGNSLIRTFTPPKVAGNAWFVFGVGKNGELYDINKVANFTYRSAVKNVAGKIIQSGNFEVPNDLNNNESKADKLYKQGENEYHMGHYENAISLYLEAINYYPIDSPKYSQAYSNLGLALLNKKTDNDDDGDAFDASLKAIAFATGPNKSSIQADSYYNLGRWDEKNGNFTRAITFYKNARKLKQNDIYDRAIARAIKEREKDLSSDE